MKNRILIISILTMLALPCYVQAVPDIEPVDAVQEEVVQPEEVKAAENILPSEEVNPESFTYKQPLSKRKVAKRFLLAMGGVVASSLIIFLGLSLYNRIREMLSNNVKTSDGEVSLQSPDDLQSAVKSFLSKTNWK